MLRYVEDATLGERGLVLRTQGDGRLCVPLVLARKFVGFRLCLGYSHLPDVLPQGVVPLAEVGFHASGLGLVVASAGVLPLYLDWGDAGDIGIGAGHAGLLTLGLVVPLDVAAVLVGLEERAATDDCVPWAAVNLVAVLVAVPCAELVVLGPCRRSA